MASRLAEKIYKLDAKLTEKFILVFFAHHGYRNQPYPVALRTIAEKTGLTERSVRRILARLKSKGLVKVVPSVRKDGGTGVNLYQLQL